MRIFMLMLVSVMSFALIGCDDKSDQTRSANDVASAVTPKTAPAKQEGIALTIVVDCSGSMSEKVADGVKSDIAKNCVRQIVRQAEAFAKTKNANVKVSLYKFDDGVYHIWPNPNAGGPNPADSSAFAAPNPTDMESSIQQLNPNGGTAIGEAVIRATHDLNESGFTNQNVLVITDGENTQGTSPDAVSAAFAKLPANLRPNVFIVAFDTNASVFDAVKSNGWKVLSAANGAQLSATLDTLVGGEILLEK